MFSGLKFIPRDQIDKVNDDENSEFKKGKQKSDYKREKARLKTKHSRYSNSSDDEGNERIKSGSRKKKKWYASEEDLSSSSEENASPRGSEHDKKKRRSRKRERRRHDNSSHSEHDVQSKKKKSRRKDCSSQTESSSDSGRDKSTASHSKEGMYRWKEDKKLYMEDDNSEKNFIEADESKGSLLQSSNNILRKEMGLEWMLRPRGNSESTSNKSSNMGLEEAPTEEVKKDNPRELNPYLKDNGSGYPEDSDRAKTGDKRILSNAVVGDGGASWRLKALKRAQEQAAREGRKLQEVVEERWGSMGNLAASVASRNVAPTHAHLQAIKNRRKGLSKEEESIKGNDKIEKDFDKKGMKSSQPRHHNMRVPKIHDTLSWGKRGNNNLSTEDNALVSTALSSLNKFSNDGNFMDAFMHQNKDNSGILGTSSKLEMNEVLESIGSVSRETKDVGTMKSDFSANQLAAKALQLRMKGKNEEAEKLLKEAENIRENHNIGNESSRPRIDGTTSRFLMHDVSARKTKKEDDADLHLAQKIVHNHRYSTSNQAADDEYDYDDGPRRKTRKKGGGGNHNSSEIAHSANRFLTQQERCQFCFENPTRPKHLVIAIANFTYLSLPQHQPVVPGHCSILTLQHESSTRTVDDNVWDEIRNFKKCLIMMFAKQEKDVVFIETVMGLAQQRRHCMVDCIPLPRDIAKQAPVYFKKAIDEAEDEWSQHNAKKLIDTSEKGLRSSIPKNFPYFHVEFGLNRGFVHVIDDEKEFKSSFGFNVIRGILRLPAEDMHRRRRYESFEAQKQAVASFAGDWEPFDWTKKLD